MFTGTLIMLLVITARTDKSRYAENHIADENCTHMFCGDAIPQAVMECGLKDPRNPYVGKGAVTCMGCISEWSNGRRTGFRDVS